MTPNANVKPKAKHDSPATHGSAMKERIRSLIAHIREREDRYDDLSAEAMMKSQEYEAKRAECESLRKHISLRENVDVFENVTYAEHIHAAYSQNS